MIKTLADVIYQMEVEMIKSFTEAEGELLDVDHDALIDLEELIAKIRIAADGLKYFEHMQTITKENEESPI